MIVLVVVVDGLDAGRTPALNEVPTDEMPIVPPAEDDLFQRSQPPASGPIETAKAQVERYWEVKPRRHAEWYLCGAPWGRGFVPALQKANGLKSPDLVPGQTISLPPRAALTSNSPQTAPPPPAQPEQPAPTETVRKNRTYTVQKGDMLERIARRELGDGRRANEIFEMNRDQLSSPDDIQPGMVLKLPE